MTKGHEDATFRHSLSWSSGSMPCHLSQVARPRGCDEHQTDPDADRLRPGARGRLCASRPDEAAARDDPQAGRGRSPGGCRTPRPGGASLGSEGRRLGQASLHLSGQQVAPSGELIGGDASQASLDRPEGDGAGIGSPRCDITKEKPTQRASPRAHHQVECTPSECVRVASNRPVLLQAELMPSSTSWTMPSSAVSSAPNPRDRTRMSRRGMPGCTKGAPDRLRASMLSLTASSAGP